MVLLLKLTGTDDETLYIVADKIDFLRNHPDGGCVISMTGSDCAGHVKESMADVVGMLRQNRSLTVLGEK